MSASSHAQRSARRRSAELRALWAWPVAMGLLSALGLVTALVSDGWGDWLSWIALGIPVAVMLWFGGMRRAPRADAAPPAADGGTFRPEIRHQKRSGPASRLDDKLPKP